MPGFQENFLGGIPSDPPEFFQVPGHGWSSFGGIYNEPDPDGNLVSFRPVRSMCFNVPIECWSSDATRFNHWATPKMNSARAANIAALLGLIYTPLSKGWLSGEHEEKKRAEGAAQNGDGSKRNSEPDVPKRVFRYMYVDGNDVNNSFPMFVIALERIYKQDRKTVCAIRVWHHIFDESHSTSGLMRRLMDESQDQLEQQGIAHAPNALRRGNIVNDGKKARALADGFRASEARLEMFAGTQYLRIVTESQWANILNSVCGQTDRSSGRHFVHNFEKIVPKGAYNFRIAYDKKFGSVHPAAPEWLCNAKRAQALSAGLVHLDGSPMNEDHSQVDPNSYWRQDGYFKVPQWVADCNSYHLMTDPSIRNVFDAALPYPVKSADKPGPWLMDLFRKLFAQNADPESSELLDAFNNLMTGEDQTTIRLRRNVAESIATFDTIDMADEDRQALRSACSNGIRSYGMSDEDGDVVEPVQTLKDIAYETSTIHSQVVAPWVHKERQEISEEFEKLNDKSPEGAYEALQTRKVSFMKKHNYVMKDLAELHLARMNTAFNSKAERKTIPKGYRAVYDGLMKELESTTNKSANLAHLFDLQMMDSDRSVFAHVSDWINTFFESDCFIDGRDWRVMQELFYHTFEQFTDQTLLLILCGPKGNGKTLRTERLEKCYVEGWIAMSGPSSAKAGMQGNSDSVNGCNCFYDEMIDELLGGGGQMKDGDNRLEYWKQILLKRKFVYVKPIPVKRSDGLETYRTVKLSTPHQETHCILTNRGPAFTKGMDDPTEVKAAMIDRSIALFVRTLGAKTHSDDEFLAHLQQEEVKQRLRIFRIFTCLVALVRMFIYRNPAFAPDMALAQKMWNEWDEGENGLDQGYGLPKPSPRKNMKRTENAITMTVVNAVAQTFLYKQTAYQFECSQLDEEGKPKPFHIKMLWEAIQLLQPTQEIIHMAWSFGLNYNIGTSEMGLNTMTIVAEQFGMKIDDMMRNPCENEDLSEIATSRDDLLEVDREANKQLLDHDAKRKQAADDGLDAPPPIRFNAPNSATVSMNEFPRVLSEETPTVSDETLSNMKRRLVQKRKSLNKYRHNCVKDSQSSRQLKDVRVMIDSVLSKHVTEEDDEMDLTVDGEDAEMVEAPQPPQLPPPPAGPSVPQPPGPPIKDYSEKELDELGDELPDEQFGALLFELEERGKEVWERLNDAQWNLQIAFMRARARKYPGPENCIWKNEGTHEIAVCPNCNPNFERDSMQEVCEEVPAVDAPEQYAQRDDDPPPEMWLSLQCSTMLPDALDASLFYKSTSLVQWSCNLPAQVDYNDRSDECAKLGTRKVSNVSRRQKASGPGGADVYDTAWLQLSGEQYKTWYKFARYVKERMNSTIANALDVHVDGLRDCLYLVSTRDNQRRCSEQPWVPHDKSQSQAFVDVHKASVTHKSTVIQVKTKASTNIPSMPPRCNESKMKDYTLDRCVMGLFVEGKLPALDFYASNRIVMSPPIRMLDTGVEANVSALHSHVTLCAEAAVVCSQIPGIRNMHERFSHNTPGPEGLTSDQNIAVGKKRALSGENDLPAFILPLQPEMDRLWAALDPKPVSKWRDICLRVYHGNDDREKKVLLDTLKKASKAHHTLPFSYDLISIAISMNMVNMLYDDYSKNQIQEFNNSGILVKQLTPETLPHLSLRYVGYHEDSRQTISVQMPTERNAEFPYIEAGDPSEIDSGVTQQYVSKILCREATPGDVRNFISSRQGATSMRGVTGDLFATSTWLKHSITSLQDRGIIVPGSTPVRALMNANSLANCRLAEGASVKGLDGFKELDLVCAKPGSYKSVEDRQMEIAIQQRSSAMQNKRRPSTFVCQSVPTAGTVDPMLAALANSMRAAGSRDVDLSLG